MINLEGATVEVNERKYTEYIFEIITKSRTYLLRTPNRIEMGEWIRDIRNAIPGHSPIQSSPYNEIYLSKITSQEIVFKCHADLIRPMDCIKGILEVTKLMIQFFSPKKSFRLVIKDIDVIFRRFFLLRNTALEVFTNDRSSFFLNFSKEDLSLFLDKLASIEQKHLPITPEKHIENYTRQWENREISNFRYLMALNIAGGRTYADFNQVKSIYSLKFYLVITLTLVSCISVDYYRLYFFYFGSKCTIYLSRFIKTCWRIESE